MRRNNKYPQTTRHMQYSIYRFEGYVGRLPTHIGMGTNTSPATCQCFPISPISQRVSFPSAFPKSLHIKPQSRATCLRHPLQPPQPRTINLFSTMPSKLTKRRPRKISAPIHYSRFFRTVILRMPSSKYFTDKLLGLTNLVDPITN